MGGGRGYYPISTNLTLYAKNSGRLVDIALMVCEICTLNLLEGKALSIYKMTALYLNS